MTFDPSSGHAVVFSGLDVVEHESVEIDGVAVSKTLRPRDVDELARVLSKLEGSGLGVLVRGGGSALDCGNPPRRADLVLATDAITGIDEFDRDDGVLHVAGGTPLSDVRAAANAEGWELPLDPPGERATVGGVLARAGSGPRELGWGAARDCVLGLDVVLPGGMRTHCGGRVVKNVTGFDLAKLYTGSLGALGVIVGAWLRLRPRPGAVRTLSGAGDDGDALLEWSVGASRRVTARAVAVACPRAAREITGVETGAWHWWAELAGEEVAVDRDAAALLADGPGARNESDGIDAVRAFQGRRLDSGGLRARLDLLPTRLSETSAALRPEISGQLIYPGLGTLYAYAGPEALEAATRRCAEVVAGGASARGSGRVCLESLPPTAKTTGDVFHLSAGERRIFASLKQRFDPDSLLNPGRGPGAL